MDFGNFCLVVIIYCFKQFFFFQVRISIQCLVYFENFLAINSEVGMRLRVI